MRLIIILLLASCAHIPDLNIKATNVQILDYFNKNEQLRKCNYLGLVGANAYGGNIGKVGIGLVNDLKNNAYNMSGTHVEMEAVRRFTYKHTYDNVTSITIGLATIGYVYKCSVK